MQTLRTLLTGLVAAFTVGCVSPDGDHPDRHPELRPFYGAYHGGFDTARTPSPDDDLNHNPCHEPQQRACDTHHAPLDGIVLALRAGNGDPTLSFYWSEQDLQADRPLDLLGRGCGTRIGPLESLVPKRLPDGAHYVEATFPLEADNRLCLGRLRPVSRHSLRLELHPGTSAGASPSARVVLDRQVRDDNYLYVVEDGVRRRVRIDVDNTIEDGRQRRYRVCIEDDHGEYDRCVLTDRAFRSVVLPVPLPGGAALSYTWWQELRPRLQRTSGRYQVERHVGVFEPIQRDEALLPRHDANGTTTRLGARAGGLANGRG